MTAKQTQAKPTKTPNPEPATPAAAVKPAGATDGDAAASAEGKVEVIDIRNMQDKFNHLLDQRNQFNDLARKAADDRNLLNNQRREKAGAIDEHKQQRDAANEVSRTHKELRNAYQDQAKALIAAKKGKTGGIERSLPLLVRKLRNDLQAAIEQQQTTQLTVAKERVLVEKIGEMWRELKGKEQELGKQKVVAAEVSDTDAGINELFAKADEEHEKVVAAMKVAQEHHEKFIAAVRETRVLVNEANKKHEEFVACKVRADDYHTKAMELREKVMQVRGEKRAEYQARQAELQEVNQSARRNVADPRALDQLKDKALDELKKGGKITLGF